MVGGRSVVASVDLESCEGRRDQVHGNWYDQWQVRQSTFSRPFDDSHRTSPGVDELLHCFMEEHVVRHSTSVHSPAWRLENSCSPLLHSSLPDPYGSSRKLTQVLPQTFPPVLFNLDGQV